MKKMATQLAQIRTKTQGTLPIFLLLPFVYRENSFGTFSQCISAGSRSISLSVITFSKNKQGGRNGKADQRDTYLRGKVQKCLSAEGWKQAV
jgi:hypothetical protein